MLRQPRDDWSWFAPVECPLVHYLNSPWSRHLCTCCVPCTWLCWFTTTFTIDYSVPQSIIPLVMLTKLATVVFNIIQYLQHVGGTNHDKSLFDCWLMPPVLLLKPGRGPDLMATSIIGGMIHNDLAAHYLLQSVIIPLLSHCTPKVRPLVISCYIYISHLIATTCCFYKLHCKPSWECVFKIPVDIDISLYHGKSSINYSKIENLVVSTNLAINQLYIP